MLSLHCAMQAQRSRNLDIFNLLMDPNMCIYNVYDTIKCLVLFLCVCVCNLFCWTVKGEIYQFKAALPDIYSDFTFLR